MVTKGLQNWGYYFSAYDLTHKVEMRVIVTGVATPKEGVAIESCDRMGGVYHG